MSLHNQPITISYVRIWEALIRWKEIDNEDGTYGRFMKFLQREKNQPNDGNILISQLGMQRLQMLNGPHWYAVLKAHQAQETEK